MSSNIITLDHGSGGKLTMDLIKMFTSNFGKNNSIEMTDSAVFDSELGITAFTTDSYVVNPVIYLFLGFIKIHFIPYF